MVQKLIHANLVLESRLQKAKKIELLLRKNTQLDFGDFLEVGCGSGYIAYHFSELGYGSENTFAVDVADQRQITKGFKFTQVSDTELPFADNKFDLVISNHVIEHVGDHSAQDHHLKEIYRVLKPGGILYFAVPNKWSLVEPHYKLPFLSWLSASTASSYLRILEKGDEYDCNLLSEKSCKNLLGNSNFEYRNISLQAIRVYASIEGGFFAKILSKLPDKLLIVLNPIIPTFIFLCKKP